MTALLILILLGGISLAAYALFFPLESVGKKKTKVRKVPLEQEIISKEQKIIRLEEEVISLENELEKLKAEISSLQNEVEQARKKETLLLEELSKREEWVRKDEAIINKVKEESLELEKKFIEQEKQLKDSFTKNVDLNRQIDEMNLKLQSLEKEKKEKSDEIELLKHQNQRYMDEIKEQTKVITELKNKEDQREWVSKRDYTRLNEEYSELGKELEAKEEKLRSLSEELIRLKKQIEEKK